MDGDAPEPIEVELVAHEPSASPGRWRRRAEPVEQGATPDGGDEDVPEPSRTERSRLVAIAAVTAVLGLVLGWIVGRTTSDEAAADVSATTRPTTTVPEPVATLPIVGENIDEPDFGEPDDGPTPASTPPGVGPTVGTSEPTRPTTVPIAIDERLAGVPLRLIGIELGGILVEVDLATGTLTDYPNQRVTTDGNPLVVGDDWIVASSAGAPRVVRSDGTTSAVDMGRAWQLIHVPGTDWFWRGPSGDPADGNVFRLVDVEGDPVGPEIEVPANAWSSSADPRTGGLVLQNVPRNYSVTPDGTEYLGTGEIVGIGRDALVTYDCDEELACSLFRTDRDTGVTDPVPSDPALDEAFRWVSLAGWSGTSVSTMSPDGRWVSVVGLSGVMPSAVGIVELATGRFVDLGTLFQYPPSVVWSADGRWAFTIDDQDPTAYDTVTGDRFEVFTDAIRWIQLGARPPEQVEPGAEGGTLLSVSSEETVEG